MRLSACIRRFYVYPRPVSRRWELDPVARPAWPAHRRLRSRRSAASYSRLIVAALAAGRSSAVPAVEAELNRLPLELSRPILLAVQVLDPRDTVGGDWTLEFTGSGWHLLGEAALAGRGKDERAIVRVLQSVGAEGAGLLDIATTAGLRQQDVRIALKSLIQQGQVIRQELPASNHAGRPRKMYRTA